MQDLHRRHVSSLCRTAALNVVHTADYFSFEVYMDLTHFCLRWPRKSTQWNMFQVVFMLSDLSFFLLSSSIPASILFATQIPIQCIFCFFLYQNCSPASRHMLTSSDTLTGNVIINTGVSHADTWGYWRTLK